MREAVSIYAGALPVSYQRDVVSLFRQCVNTMAGASIPSALAEDWLIVNQHLVNADDAMTQQLTTQPDPEGNEAVELLDVEGHEPVVVRFDLMAALTTSAGAHRLERAALAVQGHMDGGTGAALDGEQRRAPQGCGLWRCCRRPGC